MHMANHPTTTHYRENIWQVDPVAACDGRRVGLAWFSPDCKHFCKAKGTTPREQKIRGLAWSAVAGPAVSPRVIALENVEEFATWGPLHRSTSPGASRRSDEVEQQDERDDDLVVCSSEACNYGLPIKERKGQTFRAFVRKLERLGYKVEWRLLARATTVRPRRAAGSS